MRELTLCFNCWFGLYYLLISRLWWRMTRTLPRRLSWPTVYGQRTRYSWGHTLSRNLENFILDGDTLMISIQFLIPKCKYFNITITSKLLRICIFYRQIYEDVLWQIGRLSTNAWWFDDGSLRLLPSTRDCWTASNRMLWTWSNVVIPHPRPNKTPEFRTPTSSVNSADRKSWIRLGAYNIVVVSFLAIWAPLMKFLENVSVLEHHVGKRRECLCFVYIEEALYKFAIETLQLYIHTYTVHIHAWNSCMQCI